MGHVTETCAANPTNANTLGAPTLALSVFRIGNLFAAFQIQDLRPERSMVEQQWVTQALSQ